MISMNPFVWLMCTWNGHLWHREHDSKLFPFVWRCRRCQATSLEKRPDGVFVDE